jgi:hypothetical protein
VAEKPVIPDFTHLNIHWVRLPPFKVFLFHPKNQRGWRKSLLPVSQTFHFKGLNSSPVSISGILTIKASRTNQYSAGILSFSQLLHFIFPFHFFSIIMYAIIVPKRQKSGND